MSFNKQGFQKVVGVVNKAGQVLVRTLTFTKIAYSNFSRKLKHIYIANISLIEVCWKHLSVLCRKGQFQIIQHVSGKNSRFSWQLRHLKRFIKRPHFNAFYNTR